MDKKLIAFSIVGVVLLVWIVRKLQPGETQVVSQLVPVGNLNPRDDSSIQYDANKTAAFLGVLDLGKNAIAANVQSKNIDSQLALENVRADVARKSIDISADVARKSIDISADVQRSAQANELQLATISSQTGIQLAGIDANTKLNLARTLSDSATQQLELSNRARLLELEQGQQAIASAALTYRNQSLERQGTILNALTTLYRGQAPYNYQDAFGGQRPPSILQQLFPEGVGGIVKSLFSFI